MFYPWCYYTHDVMGDYVYDVIRCNEPFVSWQMEQPILFFINMLMWLTLCHWARCYYPLLFIVIIMVHVLLWNNYQSLNRNISKYQLPYIWDEVLLKSPELKLK